MLRRSRRFDGPIGQLALAVNAGDIDAVRACLAAQQDGHVRWSQQASTDELLQLAVAGRAGAEGGYRDYLQALAKRPPHGDQQAHAAWVATVLDAFDAFRILCAVRDGEWGVQGINQAVERRLEQATLIDRRGEWYAGRPVMVSRNDYGLGVYNGDVGIALPDATKEGTLRVYFQSGDKLSSVLPTRLGHVDTAFAMTVHKVQGSEFRHTVLALPPDAGHIVVRELIYTGITRASKRFTLLTPVAGVLEQGIRRQTVRASGLQCFMNAV
jgi:exodeoxyribonuclease V alpha subunit